jgi:DNA-binding NtrC family response regulator
MDEEMVYKLNLVKDQDIQKQKFKNNLIHKLNVVAVPVSYLKRRSSG